MHDHGRRQSMYRIHEALRTLLFYLPILCMVALYLSLFDLIPGTGTYIKWSWPQTQQFVVYIAFGAHKGDPVILSPCVYVYIYGSGDTLSCVDRVLMPCVMMAVYKGGRTTLTLLSISVFFCVVRFCWKDLEAWTFGAF